MNFLLILLLLSVPAEARRKPEYRIIPSVGMLGKPGVEQLNFEARFNGEGWYGKVVKIIRVRKVGE